MFAHHLFPRGVRRRQTLFRLTCGLALAFCLLFSVSAAAQQKRKINRPKYQIGIFPNPQTRRAAGVKSFVRTRPATTPAAAPRKTIIRIPPRSASPIAKGSPARIAAKPPVVRQPPIVRAEPLYNQVGGVISQLEKDGYRKKYDFVVQRINDDVSWLNSYELTAGKNYVVLSLCDDNCPVMTLQIYDAAGKLILTHKERESRPTVYFTPRRDAAYRFKTTVVACRREPCRAGLSIYER